MAKRPNWLGELLTTSELRQLFAAAKSPKHRLVLSLIYGLGLRAGEVGKIRLHDFDRHHRTLIIRNAKGGKQRTLPYDEAIRKDLIAYFHDENPTDYLFTSTTRKSKTGGISVRGVQYIVRTTNQRARLSKKVCPHTLRHCFAVQYLNHGGNLIRLKQLLGHAIVPSGGLDGDGLWISPKKGHAKAGFLFPVKAMSKVFRALYLKAFMTAWKKGQLAIPPAAPTKKKDITSWRQKRYRQDWVVYAKAPFGGPDQVVEYLGRYTHKTAISNHRLISVGPEKVSFHYKDYQEKGVQKTMKLDGPEFLRRFCLHILPPGFRRMRHYGILSNYHKTSALAAARVSLGVNQKSIPEKKPRAERVRDLLENHLGRPLSDCPDCGAKDSLIRILLPPNARAPPSCLIDYALK